MGGYSWVTLATNDSYSLGALVLAHSLKQVGTEQQLTILITPGVTQAMRSKLSEVFNLVQEVNILDSKDEANLRLLKRPELGVTFTKLHCWRLTQFDKCVFLDADTLVLENCDELFDREELSAAPDIGWPDCFNSGVFVYRPSNDTYEKLVQFALEKGSFDGGDQGLLNLYFSGWAHEDISKHLPFIYNMASTACYSYLPAFKQFGRTAKIIHFIGSSKPWLQYFDTETKEVHPSQGYEHLKTILQHWWDIFCSLIHPQLSPDMSGIAGAFAKLTLGQPRTQEQLALDDHLRRQGWEVGNIDYLGRDSFDNIWNKICETLSSSPAPPAPTSRVHRDIKAPSEQLEQPQALQTLLNEPKTVETEKPVDVRETEAEQLLTQQTSATLQESSNFAQDKPSIDTAESTNTKQESIKDTPKTPASVAQTAAQAEKCSETIVSTPEKIIQTPGPAAYTSAPVASTSISVPPTPIPVTSEPIADTPKIATESSTESLKPFLDSHKDSEKTSKLVELTKEVTSKPVAKLTTPLVEVPTPFSTEQQKPVPETRKSATETPLSVQEIPNQTRETIKSETETPMPVVEPSISIDEKQSKAKMETASTETTSSASLHPKTDSSKLKDGPSQPSSEPSKSKPLKQQKDLEKAANESSKCPEEIKSEVTKPENVVPSTPACPIKPKQSVREELKESEKSGSKKGTEVPKTEVICTTSSTTPLLPQPKQTKQAVNVDTTVPDIPPPASQDSKMSCPTPPPRKSSSGAKKSASKKK